MRAPLPSNEPLRLAALHDLDILDTSAEPAFDDIVTLAAELMGAPVAAISLTDDTRLWFKAKRGIDLPELDRDGSFCAHAILERTPLVVRDLSKDPRFAENPRVVGAPHLRSYAGAPMWTLDGYCIGTLCVVDHEPRTWSPIQIANLERLARVTLGQIELRRNATVAVDQAERLSSLAARETRYRLVLESMSEGVCVLDQTGKIVSGNETAARILGLTMDQLLGRSSYDPRWRTTREDGSDFHPDDHPAMIAVRSGVRQNGVVMGVHVPPDERRWIRINAAPVFEPGATSPDQVVVTFEDITQERAHKEQIAANAARLELALKVANAASWDIDLERGSVHRSLNAPSLFGRQIDHDMRRDFWGLIHPDDRTAVRAAWERQFAAGQPVEIDHRILRADGEVRWVHAFAGFETDGAGRHTRSYGMLVDITARKAQEIRLAEALEEAEAANRAKQMFLANMSHEIRTPLNGVISAAGALSRCALDEGARELTSIMMDSATLLERVLSDLLDYSKIEAGKLGIVTAPFNLTEDLCATVRAAEVSARAKGLDFSVDVAERARGVYEGDLLRVKQVLYNLLSNAVKFTDAGGIALVVDAIEHGGRMHLGFEVRDTGIGFDEATAERLFQRFVQADADITRRFGGTGLGLAISRQLAHLMGGDLTAESTPGEGSTFRFRLPMRRIADAERKPSAIAPVIESGVGWLIDGAGSFRVLLAEDNTVNQRMVSLILESYGVDVSIAQDGREALELLQAGRFDLVLMDLQMPGVDGLAAVREIRERETREGRMRTPIAILSANAMQHHKEEALAAGADRHIAKPFTPQSLIDGMRETMLAAVGWSDVAAVSGAA
ncbi:MAG: response regulator [Hyphomonadaceae bacterium]|nr:response regulator [Hyphomonadaceae bacterium]